MEWYYENDGDETIRYVLGTVGENPLYCFGINPSTARPNNLDNTLKSVERIALNNGYSNWIMFNVYAKRDTIFKNLSDTINDKWHQRNIEFINQYIKPDKKNDIWAAWGNLIDGKPYLFSCLRDIYTSLNGKEINWFAVKTSKAGHPAHPLYQPKNSLLSKFDMDQYIE